MSIVVPRSMRRGLPLRRYLHGMLCNLWRQRPVATSLWCATWLCVALGAPLLIRLLWPHLAADGLHFLVSLDVPLTLALAAVVTARFIARLRDIQRQDPLQWLLPSSQQGALRLLSLAGILGFTIRWPVAAALGGTMLGLHLPTAAADASEFTVMLTMGFALAMLATWVMSATLTAHQPQMLQAFVSLRGMRALSLAPIQQALGGISARRLLLTGLPVMLAAPMGVSAGQVAASLVVWWLAMSCALVTSSALGVMQSMRRWMPVLLPPRRLLRFLLPGVVGYAAAFAALGAAVLLATRTATMPPWAPAAWASLVLFEGMIRMWRSTR